MEFRHEYDKLICTQQDRSNFNNFCRINTVTEPNMISSCHDSENLNFGRYRSSTRVYNLHRQENSFGSLITVYKATHSYNTRTITAQGM
jgi:hypothetical protein